LMPFAEGVCRWVRFGKRTHRRGVLRGDIRVLMPKNTASGTLALRSGARHGGSAGWRAGRLMAGQGYGLVLCGSNRPTRFFGSRIIGCIKDCMIPETVSRDTHIPPQGCQRSLTNLFTSTARLSGDEAMTILY